MDTNKEIQKLNDVFNTHFGLSVETTPQSIALMNDVRAGYRWYFSGNGGDVEKTLEMMSQDLSKWGVTVGNRVVELPSYKTASELEMKLSIAGK